MTRPTTLLLAILLGSAWSGAAQAQAQAHASISNISVSLTDLDLNDGIAPSLVHNSLPFSIPSYMIVRLNDPVSGYNVDHLTERTVPWGPLSERQVFDRADPVPRRSEVQAVMTGSSLPTLVMETRSSSFSNLARMWSQASLSSNSVWLTLSPMTAFTFTADLAVESSYGPESTIFNAGIAYSEASVQFSGDWSVGPAFEHDTTLRHATPNLGEYPSPNAAQRHTVSFTYHNNIDHAAETKLRLNVLSTTAAAIAGPVPEPATVAMLLAGLGVIGLSRWRGSRRRKRTTAGAVRPADH